jgi:hypothetical protein
MVETKVETKQSKDVSEEEAELIFKGIKPEGIGQEMFKYYRYLANKWLKGRLKGTMFHISSDVVPIEGTKQFKKVTKTYYKSKENE